MMRRYADWDVRLARWATGLTGRPFEWGETDCASLLLGALDAMSPDPLPHCPWHDRHAARRARPASIDRLLRAAGLEPVRLPYIRVGDLAVEETGAVACGVAMGRWVLSAHRRRGVVRYPLAAFGQAHWYRLRATI